MSGEAGEDEGSSAPHNGDRRGSRAEMFGALAIIFGTAALSFGPKLVARLSSHPSVAECEALQARYVEMKQRALSEKLDRKKYQAALDDAQRVSGPSFAACAAEVTMDEVECTRRANNADEFERCLR